MYHIQLFRFTAAITSIIALLVDGFKVTGWRGSSIPLTARDASCSKLKPTLLQNPGARLSL